MKRIDKVLNRITMYRLVLYVLIALISISVVFGFFKILPFSPIALIASSLFLVAVCLFVNKVFSKILKIPTNIESVYISALILALIITPVLSIQGFILLFVAGVIAMASKYILAFKKRHIFNPAAIAVVITSILINGSASWWVGMLPLFPFILILGLIILRKIQREALVLSFLLVSVLGIFSLSILSQIDFLSLIKQLFIYSPLLFFAFIMLTEPSTTPTKRNLQIAYAILVGFLLLPQFHIGNFFFLPETALIVGNIFSYLISPNYRLSLSLKSKRRVSDNVFELAFAKDKILKFEPGQYMEWTLPHMGTDGRGNRRYFTIASSPTEENIMLGVKFYKNGSSYKKAMYSLNPKDTITASQIAGDFVLPKDEKQKIVFIAGGIGITPFRSMIKFLLDTQKTRPIILIYSNRKAEEITYADVFINAKAKIGIKTVYTLTDKDSVPPDWQGRIGRIDDTMIREEIPDFSERLFYISGPQLMVVSTEEMLKSMGVLGKNIKIDYFPGYTEV